ncbi:hypothetical protein [Empedobacter sp.]|uniref:hypothetical protein n=1 Tax=Empedobacter sp. TaxID=1927715 RepID=UPI002899C785|nr:hypothetical protein [Empedobacter sp.]
MKKQISLLLIFFSCLFVQAQLKKDGTPDGRYKANKTATTNKSTSKAPVKTTKKASTSSNKKYTKGPRGGCYYINGNGNKTYVERSLCD